MDPYSTQMLALQQIMELSGGFVGVVRSLLTGMILFIFGLIVAEIVKYVSILLLRLLRWNQFCAWAGLTAVLHKVRPDLTATVATGLGLYGWVIVSFVMLALEKTGLSGLAGLGEAYFTLLPLVLRAGVVMLGAGLAASWIGGVVLLASGHPMIRLGARLTRGVMWTLGAYGALVTLGFDREMARGMALVLLAAAALAVLVVWLKTGDTGLRMIRVDEPGEDTVLS